MARPAPAPTPAARRSASSGTRSTPRPPARKPPRKFPWAGLLGTLLIGVLLLVGAGAFAYASVSLPSASKTATSAATTVLYKDNSLMGRFNDSVNRLPLTSGQMPKIVKQAAVASEDRTFYTNRGISFKGIGRAIYGVLTRSDLGGGSTITQQYVKNISGNDDHTYTRKAKEAIQALKIDQQLSKDEILTRYLNTIYFGRNSYGVATAAQAYFGLDDPSKMTPEQAALLIGIIPSPNNWDPAKDPVDAQARYTYVMNAMVKTKAVTQAEADAPANQKMPATIVAKPPAWFSGPNGYILSAVQKEAARSLGMTEAQVANAGLTITTTIDKNLQGYAQDAMTDPSAFPSALRTNPDVKAGLVSIDPTTGGVVAMYGGADYLAHQRNAVTQDGAQAGSTFKPFTLIAALEQGISLNSTWNGNSPQIIPGYNNAQGKPQPVVNFGGEQEGQINLLKATADSVNTVFVRLNAKVTPAATKKVARQLGIKSAIPDTLSNVLGTATVTPIEMAGAYSTLAAGGMYREPHFIGSVSKLGKVVFSPDTGGQQVVEPAVNASAVYAMEGVVRSGTAASAGRALGKRPAAGKTGTINDNNAAWFNGFTPQLETAVVLYGSYATAGDGHHAGDQLSLPTVGRKQVTGGTYPTAIWTSFMTKALKGVDIQAFPPPPRSVSSISPSASPTAAATATSTASATPTATATGDATSTPTGDSTDTSTPTGSDSPTGGSGPSAPNGGTSGRPTAGSG